MELPEKEKPGAPRTIPMLLPETKGSAGAHLTVSIAYADKRVKPPNEKAAQNPNLPDFWASMKLLAKQSTRSRRFQSVCRHFAIKMQANPTRCSQLRRNHVIDIVE